MSICKSPLKETTDKLDREEDCNGEVWTPPFGCFSLGAKFEMHLRQSGNVLYHIGGIFICKYLDNLMYRISTDSLPFGINPNPGRVGFHSVDLIIAKNKILEFKEYHNQVLEECRREIGDYLGVVFPEFPNERGDDIWGPLCNGWFRGFHDPGEDIADPRRADNIPGLDDANSSRVADALIAGLRLNDRLGPEGGASICKNITEYLGVTDEVKGYLGIMGAYVSFFRRCIEGVDGRLGQYGGLFDFSYFDQETGKTCVCVSGFVEEFNHTERWNVKDRASECRYLKLPLIVPWLLEYLVTSKLIYLLDLERDQ